MDKLFSSSSVETQVCNLVAGSNDRFLFLLFFFLIVFCIYYCTSGCKSMSMDGLWK